MNGSEVEDTALLEKWPTYLAFMSRHPLTAPLDVERHPRTQVLLRKDFRCLPLRDRAEREIVCCRRRRTQALQRPLWTYTLRDALFDLEARSHPPRPGKI